MFIASRLQHHLRKIDGLLRSNSDSVLPADHPDVLLYANVVRDISRNPKLAYRVVLEIIGNSKLI